MKHALLFVGLIISLSSVTVAETTKFKQQILPIDCVYEVIDVGTQKLRYITPETCPVDPGPPIITNPLTPEGTLPGGGSAPAGGWVYVPPVQTVPPLVIPEDGGSDDDGEVQGQIGAIKDIIYQNQDILVLAGILVLLWWLAVIVRRKQSS